MTMSSMLVQPNEYIQMVESDEFGKGSYWCVVVLVFSLETYN